MSTSPMASSVEDWFRIEFHCHTSASQDSWMSPQALVASCRRKGIDRVVITDHDTITGALSARALDPQLVIVGEEIRTTRGEILAVFVAETVPPGLTPLETISILRAQGAFISLSHPFDPTREHWSLPDLLDLLPHLDAIEVYNAHSLWPGANRRARAFALAHGLPVTVGSDAHTCAELGRILLHVPPFYEAEDLRQGIRIAQMEIRSPLLWARFATLIAKLYPVRRVKSP